MHTEYGSHTSIWIKEYGSAHILLWEGKDNLFFLANWQIVHTSIHLGEKEGNTSFKIDTLWKEGCPNLKCHKIDKPLFEIEAERADLRFLLVEARSDREWVVLELDFYNKYRPFWTSPTPIVLQQERSWMKQNWDKNTRQRGKLCVSWLTGRRLNEKDGTQRQCDHSTMEHKTWERWDH